MRFWDNIRNHFYKKKLAERLGNSRENRIVTNLNDAKTVGVLYDATNPATDVVIAGFTESLRKTGKLVDVLAFVNDNKTEDKEGISVFNKKSLSWARIPESEKAEKFAGRDFDLLLACFTNENLPLEYIAQISKAKWRVGVYAPNKTDDYDMMINMGDKTDLQYLLNETIHFLNQIKYDPK